MNTRQLYRAAAGLVATIAALASGTAAQAAPAPIPAATTHTHTNSPLATPGTVRPLTTWTVENSPGNWRNSPNPNLDAGGALGNGTAVTLNCYLFGAPAGPYGNTLWYRANNTGFINDHYLNTPGTAAAPQPQAPHCGGAGSGDWYLSPFFSATNAPGTWGNSPTAATDVSGVGIGNGNLISLSCYVYGNPAGPYGNTLWYYAADVDNNTHGWINDHYLTTPGTAAAPQPQTGHC